MSATEKPVDSGMAEKPALKPTVDSVNTTAPTSKENDEVIPYRPVPKTVVESYFSKDVNGPLGFFSVPALKHFFTNLVNGDAKSGIAVAFISLPLSTALAIASGGTPLMGLNTAAFGPATAGVLGGSEYQIMGPAGALINILSQLVVKVGLAAVPFVAVLAGLMTQVVALIPGCAEKFMLVEHEHAILEGFSLAVAITIASGQINPAFGIVGAERKAYFHENLMETVRILWNGGDQPVYSVVNWAEFACAMFFFWLLWQCSTSKKLNGGGRKPKPWLMFLGVIGIVFGLLTRFPQQDSEGRFPRVLGDKYTNLRKSDAGLGVVSFEYQSAFEWTFYSTFWVVFCAVEVVIVAIMETIVSAILAQDKKRAFTGRRELKEGEMWSEASGIIMDASASASAGAGASALPSPQSSQESTNASKTAAGEAPLQFVNVNSADVENNEAEDGRDPADLLKPIPSFFVVRETFALGVGNVICGFLGGLPCTGVLLRTEQNIKNGAESKASQLFNAAVVLAVVLAAMPLFAYMPFFIIVAILVRASVGLGSASVNAYKQKVWSPSDENLKREGLKPLSEASKEEGGVKRSNFEVVNFWFVFITCLFVDGAIGICVGIAMKYVKVQMYPVSAGAEGDANAIVDSDNDAANTRTNMVAKKNNGGKGAEFDRKLSSANLNKHNGDGDGNSATVPAIQSKKEDTSWPSSDSFLDVNAKKGPGQAL